MLRKLNFGTIISLIAMIFGIAALVAYSSNVSAVGYFQGQSVPNAQTAVIIGIVLLVLIIVIAFLPSNKIMEIVGGLLKIAAPPLFIAAMMYFVSSRIEGFAFIFFSNEEVLHEVQTVENMASVQGAIVAIVMMGLAAFLALIGAFCSAQK